AVARRQGPRESKVVRGGQTVTIRALVITLTMSAFNTADEFLSYQDGVVSSVSKGTVAVAAVAAALKCLDAEVIRRVLIINPTLIAKTDKASVIVGLFPSK
ncbi:hypothetical protein KEM52_003022, partial [Ascosphaera acerosa]